MKNKLLSKKDQDESAIELYLTKSSLRDISISEEHGCQNWFQSIKLGLTVYPKETMFTIFKRHFSFIHPASET